MSKDVEHLRADRNEFVPAPQFAPIGIEDIVAKQELHGIAPTVKVA
jgi:hypothetical protein